MEYWTKIDNEIVSLHKFDPEEIDTPQFYVYIKKHRRANQYYVISKSVNVYNFEYYDRNYMIKNYPEYLV